MVDSVELTNKEQAKVAMIELVNMDTPLDERNPQHYDHDMTGGVTFPYQKTRAGALQSRNMPWDYEKYQSRWAILGGISGLLALTARIAK